MKKIFLMICCLFLTFSSLNIQANTYKGYYPNIEMNVPVITQERQGCAIASMASIEAYFYQQESSSYDQSKIYELVKEANGNTIYAYWYKCGYDMIYEDNQSDYLYGLYNQLASGYPVIVYRDSPHYSVVYGYNGDVNNLEMDGFLVCDVALGVTTYTDLKTWLGNYNSNYHYIVRRQGLKEAHSLNDGVIFAINHPSTIDAIGSGVYVYGNIASAKKMTKIVAGVYQNDITCFETTKKINTNNYNVFNLDNDMAFRKLSLGNYTYRIKVYNDDMLLDTYEFSFKIIDCINFTPSDFVEKDDIVDEPIIKINFTDVDEDEWFYGVVEKCVSLGFMSGVKKNIFAPNDNISRGMVATVLHNMSKVDVQYKSIFDDVANGQYYSKAITFCYDHKIINGLQANLFAPDENVKREDLAVMIRNYAKYMNLDLSNDVNLDDFFDSDLVSDYAKSALCFCVKNGIISGSKINDKLYLNPKDSATRAECAKMMVVFNNLINKTVNN